MNTIRRIQTGEPASEGRSLEGETLQPAHAQDTGACAGDVSVVGGSGSGKDDVVNAGELPGEEAARCPAAVRAAIVAMKSGNSDGAKGGRKWKCQQRSVLVIKVSPIALRARTTRLNNLKGANQADVVTRITSSTRHLSRIEKRRLGIRQGNPQGKSRLNHNWRAGCGRSASPVRWEGREVELPSLPLSVSLHSPPEIIFGRRYKVIWQPTTGSRNSPR